MPIELQFMPLLHDSTGNIYESYNSTKSREIFNRSNNSVHDSLVVLHGPYVSGKSTIARKIIEMFKSEYEGRVTVVNADERFVGLVEKNKLIIVRVADQINMSSIEYGNEIIKRIKSQYNDSKVVVIVELLTK